MLRTPDSELVAAWLAALRATGRSDATIQQYTEKITIFTNWLGRPVEECTRLDARRFLTHLLDNRTAGGAALIVRCVKAFYGWCVKEELLDATPFKNLSVKVPEKIETTADTTQIDFMLARAKAQTDKRMAARDGAILSLLVETGARRGEVAGLCHGDVDITSGVVKYRQSKSRARVVPLSDKAVVALTKWMRRRGTRPGGLWDVELPNQLVAKVVRKHSGGTLTPHSLRRAFAIKWLESGGSETGLVRLAGWHSVSMVSVYVRASADRLAHDEFRRLMA